MIAKTGKWMIFILLTVICLGVLYIYFYKSENGSTNKKKEVIVPVLTSPIKIKNVFESISAYGTVIPAPGAIDVVSVPYESHIVRLMVNNGQIVREGEPLLEIEPSQNTYLSLSEAKTSYETSKQTFQHTKELLDLKLATNDQVLNAQLGLEQAKLRLESMKEQGIGGSKNILANANGLVMMVNVQQGAIVPAGTTLVQIVSQNHFEINLGIEVASLNKLKEAQRVYLSSTYTSPLQVEGKIRKLSFSVNPASRLVDIFVSIPPPSPFLLGELVLGSIEVASERGMVVPRSAILRKGNEFSLYTVQDGHAVQHSIRIGIENREEVEIFSDTLKGNEDVIIRGNYELSEGMKVYIEGKG